MKSVKLSVSLLCGCIISLLSSTTFAQNSNCQLKLGYDIWEPYQFLDIGNEVRGLDIELIRMIADRMPCKIVYAQGAWIDLLPRLKKGEVDILLGASKTTKREQFAMFSDPYRTEQFVLYIRKDDDDLLKLNSFADFIKKGKKIGLVDDYFYGDELASLREQSGNKQFVGAIMGELNIARLLDQDIDAYVEDSFVGASMIRRKGLSSLIVPQGLTVTTGDVYVMFSRQSVTPDTVASFNQALNQVKLSGEYEALVKLYRQ